LIAVIAAFDSLRPGSKVVAVAVFAEPLVSSLWGAILVLVSVFARELKRKERILTGKDREEKGERVWTDFCTGKEATRMSGYWSVPRIYQWIPAGNGQNACKG
jgi:hypothetical protein